MHSRKLSQLPIARLLTQFVLVLCVCAFYNCFYPRIGLVILISHTLKAVSKINYNVKNTLDLDLNLPRHSQAKSTPLL